MNCGVKSEDQNVHWKSSSNCRTITDNVVCLLLNQNVECKPEVRIMAATDSNMVWGKQVRNEGEMHFERRGANATPLTKPSGADLPNIIVLDFSQDKNTAER